MSLTPPIKALENDDLLMSAQGWECIVQRIEEERDAATEELLNKPVVADNESNNYFSMTTDELIDLYRVILLHENDMESNESSAQALQDIELVLNSKGTIFLSEEELGMLFPDRGIQDTEHVSRVAPGYPEENDTSKNYWTATTTSTYNGYDCAILSAFPKVPTSSLYYNVNGIEVFESSARNVLEATVSHYWEEIRDAVADSVNVGMAIIADILDIAGTNETSTAEYTIDVITSMRAKFCWIYDEDRDTYVHMATAHNIYEDINHEVNNAMLGRNQELKNYTRNTPNFTDIGMKRRAVQYFEANRAPYVEYFKTSGIECEYKTSSGATRTKNYYYTPPYALDPSHVY